MPKIVVLDGYTLNPGDLSWDALAALGDLKVFDRTPHELLLDRAKDAKMIIVNKQLIDKDSIAAMSQLKYIGVTATGYNNIDLDAAQQYGITVTNVAGYSTPAVAQHVFALLLHITNDIAGYNNSVHSGDWSQQIDFCYTVTPIVELSTLKFGIYGFGKIGQAVARIALAMGMEVFAHHKHPQRDAMDGVTFIGLEELFQTCNVISLHAPLNQLNTGIVNKERLSRMPSPSYLINTGRGGLISEEDLAYCLTNNITTAAALDVLSHEPPAPSHPLIGIDNCIITPHVAWASRAARQRLLNETTLNIKAFYNGEARNIVNR